MPDVFWHRPGTDKRKKWHAYRRGAYLAGQSLCEDFAVVGCGMPNDAQTKLPKNGRCGPCFRKFNGR